MFGEDVSALHVHNNAAFCSQYQVVKLSTSTHRTSVNCPLLLDLATWGGRPSGDHRQYLSKQTSESIQKHYNLWVKLFLFKVVANVLRDVFSLLCNTSANRLLNQFRNITACESSCTDYSSSQWMRFPFCDRWWSSCCSGANFGISKLSTWLHKRLLHGCKSLHTTYVSLLVYCYI